MFQWNYREVLHQRLLPLSLQCIRLTVGINILLVAGGWIGQNYWPMTLFVHFLVFFCVTSFIGAIALLPFRSWKWAVASGLCGLACFIVIAPWYIPTQKPVPRTQGDIRLMDFNLFAHNRNHPAFFFLVKELDPDILCLQETGNRWETDLQKLEKDYPYHLYLPGPLPVSCLAVYSRYEIRDMTALPQFSWPVFSGTLIVHGKPIRLLNLHFFPPVNQYCLDHNSQDLKRLLQEIKHTTTDIIVSGDFNASPWFPAFHRFEQNSGLKNTRKGFGIQATRADARIPIPLAIDHILVSPSIQVLNCRVARPAGSDHLPLVADLRIP